MKTRGTGNIGKILRPGVLVAVLFGAMVAVPAVAAPLLLPPIVEPGNREQHPGKVVFQELVTPDIAAAERFYGGLLGWTFREVQIGGLKYAEARLDGRPVAGLVQKDLPKGKDRAPAWLTFISVADLDRAVRVALENGAKTIFGPRDLPSRGKETVLSDPQGAVFALLTSSSGDPSDILAGYGEWIWSSLVVPDPDKDAAFYQKLVDYEVFELPSGPSGTEHFLLASGDYARASVNTAPPGGKTGPHWINFVRVASADQMAARAVALGGRVLVPPRPDRHGGKLAVVADTQGAALGLMEWTEAGEEVVK